MRKKTPNLDLNARLAVGFLAVLAVTGQGYRRRGVGGWTRPDDLHRGFALCRFADLFPRLESLGLAERDDVRAPGLSRPVWVYRITPAGMAYLHTLAVKGETLPESLSQPASGPDPAVYVPPRAWTALRAMRHAADDPSPSLHVPAETGWRMASALRAHARAHLPRPHAFRDGDLTWLLQRGLAERRYAHVPGRTPPLVLYRATHAGRTVVPLEWKGPPRPGEDEDEPEDE